MVRSRALLIVLFLNLIIQYSLFSEPVDAGTLYFKNGKSLFVDYAWIESESVYAVHQGKRFAIGYNKAEIDLAKSDISAKSPLVQEKSKASKPYMDNTPAPVQTKRSGIPAPFDDLFPPKTSDRETFSRAVDERLGGNPYFRSVNEEAQRDFSRDLPALWNHVFSGGIPFRARLNPDQQNYWNDVVNRFRADVWRRKSQEIQQAKEIRDFLMTEFEMQVTANSRVPAPVKPTPSTIKIYPPSPP